MLPFALEAGVDAREYGLYTLRELRQTANAYKKRLATQASLDYRLADIISMAIGRMFDKGIKMPSPSSAYPGLIEPERSTTLDNQWESTKAFLTQYAVANNKKYSEE